MEAAAHDRRVVATLRSALAEAGYDERGLRNLIRAEPDVAARSGLGSCPAQTDEDALALLTRLFVYGGNVPARHAERVLSRAVVGACRTLRFVRKAGDALRPRVAILPIHDLLLAGERDIARHDAVLGLGPAGLTLARLTVRTPVDRALDLGCGGGLQALVAARHSGHVVGVDVNPAAVALARVNGDLNGIDNVDFRLGSWFEPVHENRFGLVVANPPYVMTPEVSLAFRDGGPGAEAMCRDVLRGACQHLEEGGFATILCNWAWEPGAAWDGPIRSWVEGTGCDALPLLYESDEPTVYAAKWNQDVRRSDPSAYQRVLKAWVDAYERAGIEAIASGAIVVRRRSSGANWVHPFGVEETPSGMASDHLRRIFAARDASELTDDEALLRTAFALVDGHELDQTLTYANGSYTVRPATMRLGAGIGVTASVDPEAMAVVLACDGRLRLEELLGEAGDGSPSPELAASVISTVRRLHDRGYLVALGGPTA